MTINNRTPLQELSVMLHGLDPDPDVDRVRSGLVEHISGHETDLDPFFRFADAFAGLVSVSVDPVELDDVWTLSVSRLIDSGMLLDPVVAIESLEGSTSSLSPVEETLRRWGSDLIEFRRDLLTVEPL